MTNDFHGRGSRVAAVCGLLLGYATTAQGLPVSGTMSGGPRRRGVRAGGLAAWASDPTNTRGCGECLARGVGHQVLALRSATAGTDRATRTGCGTGAAIPDGVPERCPGSGDGDWGRLVGC